MQTAYLSLQIGSGTRRLDHIVNNLLRLVPVVLIKFHQVNTIVLRNRLQSHVALPIEDKADTNTNTSKSAGTADAVKVGLRVRLTVATPLHWNVVVNDHGDGLNIDTSSKDVGGDENLIFSRTEFLQNAVTISTLKSSVNGNNLMTVSLQACCDLVCGLSLL